MKTLVKTGLLSILLALTGASLSAQADAPDHNGPPMGRGGRFFDKEMAANFENLKLLKLLEAVELTEEQSVKFIPLFHGLRNDMKEMRRAKKEIIEQLTEVIDQPDSDARIRGLLNRLKENKVAFEMRMNKFVDDCESILTLPQLGRLIIFQETFERQVLESLREFRRGRSSRSPKGKQGKI